MELELGSSGPNLLVNGQNNLRQSEILTKKVVPAGKASTLNHDVEHVVNIKEYIADLEYKFSRLRRALGAELAPGLTDASNFMKAHYSDEEQYSYVDYNSTRVDDCRIPYFKETVEDYLKEHGRQTNTQVTQEDRELNDQLNPEPNGASRPKITVPQQNVESEKSRLQNSILRYSQEHPDSNSIVKVAASNISNCRIESLRMVEMLKHYVGKSEQERIEEMYKRSSLQSVKLRKTAQIHIRERNSSARDLIMTLKTKSALGTVLAGPQSAPDQIAILESSSMYFLTVLVYDSVKKKKQAELVCSVNNTFAQLFDSIECPCRFADPETSNPFSPFMSLNEHVVARHQPSQPTQQGLQATLQARKKAGLPTTFWHADTTKLWQVPLKLGQGLIFRDLPRCDHLVLFKDLFKDPELARIDPKQLPIQTFYPRLHRQTCEACASSKFARVVVHKDKHSLKELTFYCKECYEDLFLDEAGVKKDPEVIVLPYLHD